MPVKNKCDAHIWRASLRDVDLAQWRVLTKSLGLSERSRAFEFRYEADRKAYVLACGLRRLALAAMLDVQPEKLVFRDDKEDQRQLIKPSHRSIYFSHSHTREGVLFAASFDAAVDAESVAARLLEQGCQMGLHGLGIDGLAVCTRYHLAGVEINQRCLTRSNAANEGTCLSCSQ